jgi:thymidylate synthase
MYTPDSDNMNGLWYSTIQYISTYGRQLESRAGSCAEVIGFQAVLTDPLNNWLFIPGRKLSLSYASAEMLWYLSGTNKIDMIKAYAPQYERFAEKNIAYGAYGYRWAFNPGFASFNKGFELNFDNQLEALVHLLRTDPNTRQAIITMWDSGDLIHAIGKGHKDLPCTIALNFFVREGCLHLVATMRSNDSWLGLPYDIFCFTYLQRLIASMLKLELGVYIHQAGSEHIYSTNIEKIQQILQDPCPNYPYSVGWISSVQPASFEDIGTALRAENAFRSDMSGQHTEKEAFEALSWLYTQINGLHPILKDLVLGAATKWVTKLPAEQFENPLFQVHHRIQINKESNK